MKISTKGRYAFLIMVYLAKHYTDERYIRLKEISENENISLKYLEKIITNLNKNNYLLSQRGSEGGYKLSKSPENYNILELLEKAEGDIKVVSCVGGDFVCQKSKKCTSFKLWNELNNVITDYLKSKTLKDFMEE